MMLSNAEKEHQHWELIKKIWPQRKPVRRLRPAEFNPIIEELARTHCG
jgi:hypothetical protein